MTNFEDDMNVSRLPAASTSNSAGNRISAPKDTGRTERGNDAAWIKTYIENAAKPVDLSPAKRRIRHMKFVATDKDALNADLVATELVAKIAPYIPLPRMHDPWEEGR